MKYKVWHIERKVWIHDSWNVYIDPDGDVYEIEEKSMYMQQYMYRERITDEVNVVWSTGLKDKNDTEIYEGDLAEKGSTLYQIVWSDRYARYGAKVIKSDSVLVRNQTFPLWQYVSDDMQCSLTIIGNKYEHSHLLEG